MTIHPEPRYLVSEDVAQLCRTSPETVRFWRFASKGPRWFKVGRRVLYLESDVQAWLEEARATASSAPDAAKR